MSPIKRLIDTLERDGHKGRPITFRVKFCLPIAKRFYGPFTTWACEQKSETLHLGNAAFILNNLNWKLNWKLTQASLHQTSANTRKPFPSIHSALPTPTTNPTRLHLPHFNAHDVNLLAQAPRSPARRRGHPLPRADL